MIAGEQQAFDDFFDGHFPGLYRFALRRLGGNPDLAEETAQAAICKAITKLETYRGEASLFTWLCTFCRHEISALHRRNKVAARGVDLIEDAPEVRAALESLGAVPDSPARAFDRQEIGQLVQVVLDRLPAHYGHALEWKYVEELPVKTIAARLKISPKAAESLLTRAREAFRDGFSALIGPRGPEPMERPR
jgi:RNA polymerase sigma-70 factor (ECF subfamily)